MSDTNSIYFKQLLSGIDFGVNDPSARSMANFVYLIGDTQTRECVVVDPAWDIDGILKILKEDDMKLTGALVTHYHPDHVGGEIFGMEIMGLAEMMGKYPVPVYVNKHEADGLKQVTGISMSDMRQMDGGDIIKVGAIDIKCLHTPGHTPGSQCFRVANSLVAGDTLFLQGCGRVDLPGGDSEKLFHTLTRKLSKIQDKVVLFPGHNYGSGEGSASMGEIRRTNSYLQIDNLQDWFYLMGR